jgi:transcriptional regulator with XRE-family HTH domain
MGYLRVDGQKLKSLRDARGFSSAVKLGEAAGEFLDGGEIAGKTIERYEKGGNARPDYLRAIARALGVNWTELLAPEALTALRRYVPTFITGETEEELSLLYKSFESRLWPWRVGRRVECPVR